MRPLLTTDAIERWLREDIGHRDVTNDVPGETTGQLVSTEPGVIAGIDAASAVFEYLDVAVTPTVSAGDRVDPGTTVLKASGDAQAVLRGERLVVNLVGHASGVATQTRQAVEMTKTANTTGETHIAGTRKTTPGLRGIEKRAVVAGGGDTHRLTLSGLVMIKDNHIAELGLTKAINRFRERKSFATKLEVEVESPEMAVQAAEAGADIVLFDNLHPETVRQGVMRVPDDILTEASGGITVEMVDAYAETGVDIISMGSLTHSASSLDLSFRTDE
ncbi:MAG: nicotinate-nucleotide pyrophosphorylase [Haloquadratum walsbyi J07HQW2]|uniref:Nicotinate-nucleotide pyrophosphorylase [carboxylating] n=1 Tax=Haloquadratum walsbyi J07HQW2 TaxID=1238425 RepID=U1NF21_9EURY|nr:MAG: nicotinate-nucleotide pyrophosphorylase [Haloquadratum walsbyi J07HQW2]